MFAPSSNVSQKSPTPPKQQYSKKKLTKQSITITLQSAFKQSPNKLYFSEFEMV